MESIVNSDLFINRHLGLSNDDEQRMLSKLGFKNIDQFIDQVVPVSYTHLTLPTRLMV